MTGRGGLGVSRLSSAQIGVSQYAVFGSGIARELELLAGTGIPGVEIFMEGPAWWKPEALRAVEDARPAFAGPLSVHPPSWDINIASYTRPVRDTAMEVYRQAVEVAGRLGAAYVVVHIGWRGMGCFPRAGFLARAEEAIHSLVPHARRAGTTLAVENVGWHGSEVCDQAEFTDLVRRLPTGAGALLDVGHALLAGWDIPAAARALAPRMIAMHLHDNDGRSDQHLPIGRGRIDWEKLFPLLPGMAPGCQYVLEYAPGTSLAALTEGRDLLGRVLSAGARAQAGNGPR